MQVIGTLELHNPNVCTICEERPDGDSVIDTERWTPFNPSYPLNGRKYVCVRCGDEIARLFGYASDSAISQIAVESTRANDELKAVRGKVLDLAQALTDYIKSPAVAQAVVPNEPKISLPDPVIAVIGEPVENPETRSYEDIFGTPEVTPEPVKRAPGRPRKSTIESRPKVAE